MSGEYNLYIYHVGINLMKFAQVDDPKNMLEHFQNNLFMDENVKMEDELNFLLWIKRTFIDELN